MAENVPACEACKMYGQMDVDLKNEFCGGGSIPFERSMRMYNEMLTIARTTEPTVREDFLRKYCRQCEHGCGSLSIYSESQIRGQIESVENVNGMMNGIGGTVLSLMEALDSVSEGTAPQEE